MKSLLQMSVVVLVLLASRARAADKEPASEKTPNNKISFAEGKLQMTAADTWKRKKPESNIIEHEFAIPASEGDERDGRLTIMGAGGSVEQNVERWVLQFPKTEGEPKINRKKIAGEEVTLVDISGTYKDQRGPFGGTAVERENYRMLAAIVSSKQLGNYFVKFYGPAKTVGDNQKAFAKMVEGIEKK